MKWSIEKYPQHSLKFLIKKTVSAQLHLVASIAAMFGLAALMKISFRIDGSEHFWSCLVFGVTGILVFTSSALYHFCNDGFIVSPNLEKVLNDLDHFSIYLFIAGTYTPFLINVVLPPWRQILLIAIWVVAFTGVAYSYFKSRLPSWAQHRVLYTGLFIAMGWTLIIRGGEVYSALSPKSLGLLIAGALSYTIGALCFAFDFPKFRNDIFGSHELWHVMVMLGFGFHYFLILGFYT